MLDLLLTHGYFLFEDPKERQIMKPYAPLGILYLCSHLRGRGFDVDVFDTTFSSREQLFNHLRTEKPSVLGVYANLMTRSNVVETLSVAREAGWTTVVGGPEPGAYSLEYLQAGAHFVVAGEGELTMEDLLLAIRCGEKDFSKIAGLSYLDTYARTHHVDRSRISIYSRGRHVAQSIFVDMLRHGEPITALDRSTSSQHAGVLSVVTGVATRSLGSLTGGVIPSRLSMRWSGYSNSITRTWFGSPMMCSQ
jgi:radical SAM superfamily enzyme YgiQ (UPF0313 family)